MQSSLSAGPLSNLYHYSPCYFRLFDHMTVFCVPVFVLRELSETIIWDLGLRVFELL